MLQSAVAEAALREQTAELLAVHHALDAERQRYQDLFEFAPDSHLVTDPRGVIREANRAAGGLFNHAPEFLVGKPLLVLIAADERWDFQRQMARLAEQGQVRDWTLFVQPRAAPPLPVSVAVAAVWDRTGQATDFRWLLRDISEQRRLAAAAEVRHRQQQVLAELEHLVVGSSDLAALLDEAVGLVASALQVEHCHVFEMEPSGNALHLRAGSLTADETAATVTIGAGADSLAGYTLLCGTPVIVPDLRTETRFRPAARLLERQIVSSLSATIGGHPQAFGVIVAHTTQRRTFTQDEVYFLQSAANRLALAVIRNRSESEWAQHLAHAEESAAHVRELEAMRRTLLSAVSHELLTPLSIIKGHAETLRDPDTRANADVADSALVAIDEEVDRLRRIVGNLLDAARATTGDLAVQQVPLPLGPLIDRSVHRFRGRSRRHAFVLHAPATLPLVLGDASRLESVLYNLLDNAVKYAPRGGEVLVRVEVTDHDIEVVVADYGGGIPVDEQARIFQPYYRAQPGARQRVEGSGLGLYICKSIVEALGGRIWVESEPSRGAAFHFTVPRADRPSLSEPALVGAES